MLKNLDRALAMLLSLGAIGHTFGAIVLVGAINLLRTWRPGDRLLACLAATGTLCWLVISVAFGVIINNLTDFRVVVFAIL